MELNKALKPRSQEEIDRDIRKANPEDALISCIEGRYMSEIERLLSESKYLNCIFIPNLNDYKEAHKVNINVNSLNIITFISLALDYENEKILDIFEKYYPIETMFFRDIILRYYKENMLLKSQLEITFVGGTEELDVNETFRFHK